MILYRATSRETAPVAVECPDDARLRDDAQGFRIYDNTHFVTLKAAWAQLQANAEAGVRNGCAKVADLRQALAAAEAELVNRTLRAEAIKQARRDAERNPSS